MATQGIVDVRRLREIVADFGTGVATRQGRMVARGLDVLEAKAVELAPVDIGNLEAATSTDIRTLSRSRTVGQLSFNTPYAARVHELPQEARGPKTQQKAGNELGPAGPKYLERALQGMEREWPAIIAEEFPGG